MKDSTVSARVENNVKLEQEIVSYYLVKDINYTIPPLY